MEYLNAALYVGLFAALLLQRRSGAALLVAGIWCLAAVVGIPYFHSDVYREGQYPLQVLPFVLLFVWFVISLVPLLRQHERVTSIEACSLTTLKYFVYALGLISVPAFIEIALFIADSIATGEIMMLGANYDEVAQGELDASFQKSWFTTRAVMVLNYLRLVTPVLFFYLYSKEKRLLAYICLLAAAIPALDNVSIGSRTQLVFTSLYFIILYVFMQHSIGSSMIRQIRILIGIIGGTVVALMLVLTIGRFVIGDRFEESSLGNYLYQYTAESVYNFNNNMYHTATYLDGDMCVLPVKVMLGMRSQQDLENRRMVMQGHTNIPIWYFYTLYGDIYSDVGFLPTFIVVALMAFLFCQIKVEPRMRLSSILLLAIYLYVMVNSIFYFSLKLAWATIFWTIAAALIMRTLGEEEETSEQVNE